MKMEDVGLWRQSIAMASLPQGERWLSRRRRGRIAEHVQVALLAGNRKALPVEVRILDGMQRMARTKRES
jgi:hypothetical protein